MVLPEATLLPKARAPAFPTSPQPDKNILHLNNNVPQTAHGRPSATFSPEHSVLWTGYAWSHPPAPAEQEVVRVYVPDSSNEMIEYRGQRFRKAPSVLPPPSPHYFQQHPPPSPFGKQQLEPQFIPPCQLAEVIVSPNMAHDRPASNLDGAQPNTQGPRPPRPIYRAARRPAKRCNGACSNATERPKVRRESVAPGHA
ncbi:hypothetical protein M409DRAFT_60292 [Zasmidium cellare ATCC 36951]|uniref:Uncharacterized protein n=1 Tax=Zasmidium cellare ATCC 36951 TaxID=1080233 RepID=A0A6A6C2R7_ZASCE|nr:uncharacterized protein M409DRAFT_60292 [Zasmidium cellare ATCC 36951]KAF2160029.1 hypothetical protein M409DRAFT_60292 [Zasmidium cellare ATCC 36951]